MTGRMLGAIVTLAVAGSIAVTAQGRPAPAAAATVSLNKPTTASTDGLWPHLGDWVTFSATYPKQAEKYDVSVQVVCYQAGKIVYAESRPWQQQFLLGSFVSEWQTSGGGADCVADLYYWTFGGGQKFNWLATTSFYVSSKY